MKKTLSRLSLGIGLVAPLLASAEPDWVAAVVAREQAHLAKQHRAAVDREYPASQPRANTQLLWATATARPPSSSPLIRSRWNGVAPARPAASSNSYAALIQRHAYAQRLPPRLVQAMIQAESSFQRRAVSPKGAQGLMQLMPATARRFGVENPFDPEQNIAGGTRYMAWLLDTFNNDLRLALAGYNAGEGAVRRYGHRIPPFPETRRYVRRVLRFYGVEH